MVGRECVYVRGTYTYDDCGRDPLLQEHRGVQFLRTYVSRRLVEGLQAHMSNQRVLSPFSGSKLVASAASLLGFSLSSRSRRQPCLPLFPRQRCPALPATIRPSLRRPKLWLTSPTRVSSSRRPTSVGLWPRSSPRILRGTLVGTNTRRVYSRTCAPSPPIQMFE